MNKIVSKLMRKKVIVTILKLLGGCFACFIVPPLLTKLVVKPLLGAFALNENLAEAIKFSFAFALVIGTYLLYFKIVEKREVKELKLFPRFNVSILSFLAGIAAISIVIGILSIIGLYKINEILLSPLLFAIFMDILCYAAFEECLFRGVIYRILEQDFGFTPALIISSLLFAVLHLFNPNATIISVLSIGLGGAVFALLFSITKNLWVLIFFHTGWNLAQFLFGVNISGVNKYSDSNVFKSTLTGPDVLTGGKFGPENSIITIVLLLSIILYLYKSYIRKSSEALPSD